MPRKSRPAIDFHQPRFMQISEAHCGPAVVQMLLSGLGIEVTQEQVAEAGGANNLIDIQGMRVDQLAQAVKHLAPRAKFYIKEHATVEELVRIVENYRTPVGVEWQGVFEDEDAAALDRGNKNYAAARSDGRRKNTPLADSETGDSDYGHYSLVVRASRRRKELIIADPYKDFFSQARVFDFSVFDRRWYDYNEVIDPLTGQPDIVKDDHLLFVVTRGNVLFPRRMGLRSA